MQVSNNTESVQCDMSSQVAGRVSLNRLSRIVAVDNREVTLTSAEFELLDYLVARAGKVVSRDELFQQVLGLEYNGLDRTIDLRVSRLRRKLGDRGERSHLIKSIRSEGYIFAADGHK